MSVTMGRLLVFSVVVSSAIGTIIKAAHHTTATMEQPAMTLFDFTKMNNVNGWVEQSDTVRTPGMSKAVLTLQKTQIYQRAIFFALLNPQPNGAGFAGVRKLDHFSNLAEYNELHIKCRGQGVCDGFKVVLRHKDLNDEPDYTYEQTFTGPKDDFDIIILKLDDFKPYYRGALVNTTETLDKSNITGFGIQFYGGVYLPIKQSGPATLEVDWIKAVA